MIADALDRLQLGLGTTTRERSAEGDRQVRSTEDIAKFLFQHYKSRREFEWLRQRGSDADRDLAATRLCLREMYDPAVESALRQDAGLTLSQVEEVALELGGERPRDWPRGNFSSGAFAFNIDRETCVICPPAGNRLPETQPSWDHVEDLRRVAFGGLTSHHEVATKQGTVTFSARPIRAKDIASDGFHQLPRADWQDALSSIAEVLPGQQLLISGEGMLLALLTAGDLQSPVDRGGFETCFLRGGTLAMTYPSPAQTYQLPLSAFTGDGLLTQGVFALHRIACGESAIVPYTDDGKPIGLLRQIVHSDLKELEKVVQVPGFEQPRQLRMIANEERLIGVFVEALEQKSTKFLCLEDHAAVAFTPISPKENDWTFAQIRDRIAFQQLPNLPSILLKPESDTVSGDIHTSPEAAPQPECLVRDVPMAEVNHSISRCAAEVLDLGRTLYFTRGVKDAGSMLRSYDQATDAELELVTRGVLQARSKRYFNDAAGGKSFAVRSGSGEPRPVVLAPVSPEIIALREKRRERETLLVERFCHLTIAEIREALTRRVGLSGSESDAQPVVAQVSDRPQPECLVRDIPMSEFNQRLSRCADEVLEHGRTLFVTHGVESSGAVLRPFSVANDSNLASVTRGKLRTESKRYVHRAAQGTSFLVQSGTGAPRTVVLAPVSSELMALREKKRMREEMLVEEFRHLALEQILGILAS